jgi:hypothetical protein
MEKHIEHKKAKDEQSFSDREIWWKIRYLDPDIKRSDSVVIISVLAILSIVGVVVALLYSLDCEVRVGTNRTVIGTASEPDTEFGREGVFK